MKSLDVKYGTKNEILDYLKSKIKGTERRPYSIEEMNEGDMWEPMHSSFAEQIDTAIDHGSPFVAIQIKETCVPNDNSPDWFTIRSIHEKFLIEDYAKLKLEMEMKRLDDMDARNRRINAIKAVMAMEMDAEERWDRILKIVDEFEGKLVRL